MYCKPTYFFDTHNKQYLDKLVKLIYYLIYIISLADMAELVDAYGSGPYECKFMQVQVLLSAPHQSKRYNRLLCFFL